MRIHYIIETQRKSWGVECNILKIEEEPSKKFCLWCHLLLVVNVQSPWRSTGLSALADPSLGSLFPLMLKWLRYFVSVYQLPLLMTQQFWLLSLVTLFWVVAFWMAIGEVKLPGTWQLLFSWCSQASHGAQSLSVCQGAGPAPLPSWC